MSSDSDEDIFGNVAKKLKILCSKYTDETKMDHCEILSDTTANTTEIDNILNGVTTTMSSNSLIVLSDNDDTVNISEKGAKLKKKPDYPSDLSDNSDTEIFMLTHQTAKRKQSCRKSKRVSSKKAVSNKTVKNTEISDSNINNSSLGVKTRKKTQRKSKSNQDVLPQPIQRLVTEGLNGNQNYNDINNLPIITLVSPVRGRSKGRRGRGGRSRGRQCSQPTTQYPTYNIGNTEEYPDVSKNIPLFSSKPTITNEILISDEDTDENEELTIHVHWQNSEIFKFNIRKFQKIKQVFDFFAKKENVLEKRLFFAYNDVVLTSDDTPDTMQYNIANFIEAGLVSEDLINPVRENTTKPSGTQIKFQCQNFKKPYEISVQPFDKLSLAMLKCAEHFEKPLDNLRFEFDGERITGTTTIKELELESGDCIDVRIIK